MAFASCLVGSFCPLSVYYWELSLFLIYMFFADSKIYIYIVVGRVRGFFELKHGRNGVGEAEISNILGPKQHCFGALEVFFYIYFKLKVQLKMMPFWIS